VLDSYFNFTNKSNLINSLKYDLIRFFDYLGVAYFFCVTTLYIRVAQISKQLSRIIIKSY